MMSDLEVKITDIKNLLKFLVKVFRNKARFRQAMLFCNSCYYLAITFSSSIWLTSLVGMTTPGSLALDNHHSQFTVIYVCLFFCRVYLFRVLQKKAQPAKLALELVTNF